MSTYSEYPVFEPNQVLSYTHLNDLVGYLEKQDRDTRNKLIGIGILCGLQPSWKPTEEVVYISKGTAVTSQGFLISLKENFYNKFLPYTLPGTSIEESSDGEFEDEPYHFFKDQNNENIDMWELLPTDFVQEEGEEEPGEITEEFLNEKVILLYLECERESLRNCDINDCSDKGAKMTFDIRVIAINESDAIDILHKEEEIAKLPVHLNEHPKFNLNNLNIEKINPSRYNIKNFIELYSRIKSILDGLKPDLIDALENSFETYQYLLTEIYPESDFPSGPFDNLSGHLARVNSDFAQNLISLQYLYDFYYDLVQSYNEFIHFAHKFVAECCPNPKRFPKHILLGKPDHSKTAFSPTSLGNDFNPILAQTGLAPSSRPLQYRHYFIPSMIFQEQGMLLNKIRSLHYRLYLSAFRYDSSVMNQKDIQITPSKDGEFYLSEKSIPFYYAFNGSDDFHANWSFNKTIRNDLNRILSYQFISEANVHPLLNKMDDHNFYRIEGHIGQGLATVMKNLINQKKDLGLSFAIEPIYFGLTGNKDQDNEQISELMNSARRLLMCKMRDLDIIFLILIAILFFMLFMLLILLSRIGRSTLKMPHLDLESHAAETIEKDFPESRNRDFIDKKIIRQKSDKILKKIRNEKGYDKGTVVKEINKESQVKDLGNLYLAINGEGQKENLYERTHRVIKREIKKDTDVKTITEAIYPTVALMDSTEDLMKSLSSESISKFDFELFEARYNYFVEAFTNFDNQDTPQILQKDQYYAEAKQYTAEKRSVLATDNTQSLLGNLSGELSERFFNILSEMTLPGYASKHPEMEHKAGVPKGGTFVILYAHKDSVDEDFKELMEELGDKFILTNEYYMTMEHHLAKKKKISFLEEKLVAAKKAPKINAMAAVNFQPSDPLDNYIVLGDFCISTQCCDGDCSDIFEEEVEQGEATITGTVRDAGKGNMIFGASVTAININTNEAKETEVDENGYSLNLPDGTYKVIAKARAYEQKSQTITIQPNQTLNLDFELEWERINRLVVELYDGRSGYDINTDTGKEALRFYGSRYNYYNSFAEKNYVESSGEVDEKNAEIVASWVDTMMSPKSDINKINKEYKKTNSELVKLLDEAENEKSIHRINESLKVVHNSYLDKISLISPEKMSSGTKRTFSEVEKINKKSSVNLGKLTNDWIENNNLSKKPKVFEAIKKLKLK
ncbi:carboxypeptidase-like regulatory domain-containing protein [Mangrovivirga sp. M17]|uniref:Carboxypeptidase-like regulatory domain-containing protein n=1 Tax=Mangrovivirga halotolerans TaxID=2993936 RepID=A0ABT3RR82_9BACT|nr:carboxypeptidase-like regulatory domain-containing protein [Mangrovivirga halotolerans]MCX2743878.1 carboxypeptidase-like regulatory domain-containing protein [Mangrovivirga halotolerans]